MCDSFTGLMVIIGLIAIGVAIGKDMAKAEAAKESGKGLANDASQPTSTPSVVVRVAPMPAQRMARAAEKPARVVLVRKGNSKVRSVPESPSGPPIIVSGVAPGKSADSAVSYSAYHDWRSTNSETRPQVTQMDESPAPSPEAGDSRGDAKRGQFPLKGEANDV
jgi:hypothetical protein